MSPLLEAYEWEKMDPKERQDRWEQENLKELERTTSFQQQAQLTLVQGELERITSFEERARKQSATNLSGAMGTYSVFTSTNGSTSHLPLLTK